MILKKWFLIGMLTAAGLVLVTSPCMAQAAGGSAAEAATAVEGEGAAVAGMTWQQILDSGGWLMYVLAFMSVLTVAFVIYFFAVLRTGQVAPRALRRELVERIREDAIDEARRACEYRPCPLSAVTMIAIDYIRDTNSGDAVLLKDVIEGEGSRQAESIQGQTQYLQDIAVISPMVGLLGTVFGMLRAFSSVALNEAAAKPVVLAQGVSQALVTTAFGLMVGIPAMMFYSYFRRRASRQVSYLESASAEVLTALLGKENR